MRHVALAFALTVLPLAALADDSREDYYYPKVGSEERFTREIGPETPSDRATRIGFVNEVTRAQFETPSGPRVAVFAKGSEAQHMVITGLDSEIFETLFRARGVMAQMTASARQTAFFKDNGIDTSATWYDLAKMLGFEDIVLTDGETWAHRVILD